MMKPLLKLSLSVLSVGLVAGLAVFGWSVKAKDDATFHLANGVEVTPIEVKQDDVADALDAKIWKFYVTLPDTSKMYDYEIVLCRRGKAVDSLGGVGIGPIKTGTDNSQRSVTISMVPLDDTFSGASRVKYHLQAGSGGTFGTFANPFKGGASYSSGAQVSSADNLVYMMSGGNQSGVDFIAGQNAVSIAFKVKAEEIKH